MYVRTLGGLKLEGASFHRPKPLLLLAYLALEGPTERRYLSELFWLDAANSRRSLSTALSQLRAGAPGAVGSTDARVWSDIACDATQLLRAAEEKDWLRAVELYRGPFLEGCEAVASGPEIEEWIYRTRELLAHTVCRALLAVGEHAAMAGNFGEAGTWALRAEAAAEPSPLAPHDLGRLYALLLATEQHPRGALYEEASAFGLDLPGSVGAARERYRAAVSPASTDRLPSRTTSFVGRQPELEKMSRLVEDPTSRLVTLAGAGGTGKTRLALEFATEAARSGRWSGVLFVSLETLQDPNRVASSIAATLGIQLEEPARTLDEIRHTIGSSRTLLVLDNFEHLLLAAPVLVRLLRDCANLWLIVTSRERLNLDEEHLLLVGGLSVPASESVSAEDAMVHDAVSLFVQRARRSRPDFTLNQTDLAGVVRICRLVGGMPLALEMASAWLSVMSAKEIADEIARSLDVLESSNPDLPERHRNMRVAFEHSWRLSSIAEQRLLRALTVFRGGFSRDAANEVASIRLSQLRTLVDRSLLSWNGIGRYELHPLLHQFLSEKVDHEPDEAAEVRERHANYFLERVAEERSVTPHKYARRDQRDIEIDLANILAGWEWAAGNERSDLLERATHPLGWYFFLHGRPVQGIAWSDMHADAPPESLLALRQVTWKAAFLKDVGGLQTATQHLERAAHTAQRLGADSDLAIILRIAGLAYVDHDPPRYADAKAVFRRAFALHEQMGDMEGMAMTLNNLAYVQDDPKEAHEMLEHGLRLARQAGQTHTIGTIAETLAKLLVWSLGDYEAGLARAAESVACHEEMGFSVPLAVAYASAGEMHAVCGDVDEIEAFAERALGLTSSVQGGHATAIEGIAFALQGHAARFRANLDSSAELYRQAVGQIQDGPSRSIAVSAMGSSLNGLARIALLQDRPTDARAHATRAIEYLSRHANPRGFRGSALRVSSHVHLGESLMLERRNHEAEAQLQEALRRATLGQQVPSILEVLLALGTLRHNQGKDPLAQAIAATVAAHAASPYEVAERARALQASLPPSSALTGTYEQTLEILVAAASDTSEDGGRFDNR